MPIIAYTPTVYRVNWLRAKARHARWEEEVRLLKLEMGWIVNWFAHKKMQWQSRVEGVEKDDDTASGLISYAARQQSHWHSFEQTAAERFQRLLKSTGDIGPHWQT